MASIGRISILLTARTRAFERSMTRAQRRVKEFRDNLGKLATRAGLAAAAVGTGLALGLSRLAQQQARVIDQSAKFADTIGIATEELVAFQHAGRLAGIENRTLQMGLQRMTRRISEAAAGFGEARGALQELGLDAARLNREGPGAAFLAIADSMQRVESQADRVRLAMKLFDSEGVALVRLLNQGSDGLEEIRREAARLGLLFSREEAAQVEAMNDSITRLGASAEALGNRLAIAVAPTVRMASDELGRMLSIMNRVGEVIVRNDEFWREAAATVAGGLAGVGFLFDEASKAAIRFFLTIETRGSKAVGALTEGIAAAIGISSDPLAARVGQAVAASLLGLENALGEGLGGVTRSQQIRMNAGTDRAVQRGISGLTIPSELQHQANIERQQLRVLERIEQRLSERSGLVSFGP